MSDVPDGAAIYDAMSQVLTSIESVYEDEDAALPDRRYLAMNSVAHDCEQLTIAFQQMYAGPPGSQLDTPIKCDGPRTIVVQIQLVRCIPVPTGQGRSVQPPTPEMMIESTEMLTADCWFLMKGFLAADPVCNYLGGVADVSVTDPDGGLQAVQLNASFGVP